MARYLVYLADGGTDDGSGCIREILLTLRDPLWGANTWSIDTPNSWIGIGSGTYTVKVQVEKVLTVLTASGGGSIRFELLMTNYPNSFDSGSGGGAYVSPFGKGNFALRWWGEGAIRPEPCPN